MITCEYLLNSIAEKPLNEEERNAMELYREELAKALDADLTQAEQSPSLFCL
jgi:hypothetical protein